MASAEIIGLGLICLTNALIGLFVLFKNRQDRTNQFFFVFVISIIGWLLTTYFSNAQGISSFLLTFLNMAVFAFPAITAFFALAFALQFTGVVSRLKGWQITAGSVFALLIFALTWTPLVVAGLTLAPGGIYNITFGPATPLFFVYMVAYFGATFAVFVFSLRRSSGAKRARLQWMLAGIAASFGIALFTNLIMPAVAHNYTLVSFGSYSTLLLVGGISYAIVRHRMFDIRMAVARSVAFALLLLTASGIYGTAIFAMSQTFFPANNFNAAQGAIYIGMAMLLAFTFEPMKRFFEKVTDRIFYRDRYDSQEVLNNLSQIFVSELHLERILKKSLTALCESLHIQFGQIVVFKDDRVYRIEHYGPLPKRLMVAPELRRLNRSMLIADELEGGERKKLLDGHGVRVSMLLSTREEFIGYLLLGDKLSGDIYSSQDIKVLEILRNELAVAILNARAYAEIEAFNAHLQERVDKATKRLRVANTHLKELDRVKDEFISMASHQLRTPLTTIKGYLSMMLEGDVGPVPAQQREFVNYAFTSSERMVNLISDLLNVSRLQAGRFLIQTKPTDMVKMIQEEVHQLESHAKAKNIALLFDPPPHALPEIEIDENKTRQVIMNFIDNAIYYTQKGEVRVNLEQTEEYVRLLVKDTGIGVPKDAQKKLFSKFFRATNAQTVRPDGTGLGLYLAKRVVEDQGGTIIFESVEGKGSTFGFQLPIKPIKPVKKEVKRARPALHR